MTSGQKDGDAMTDAQLIHADGEAYRNPSEVQMSQIVMPCHANHCGELSVGQLLKWMDSTACLSGRRQSLFIPQEPIDHILYSHTHLNKGE